MAAFLEATLIATGRSPHAIPVIDLILIMFATFRLTQLIVVYDKIFTFIRNLFKGNETGIKKTADDLISCSWCVSVWVATIITFVFNKRGAHESVFSYRPSIVETKG